MKHSSLDANEPYQALSYVWGDNTKNRAIRVNDCYLRITRNLFEALLQLRVASEDATVRAGTMSWIWIDAICTYLDRTGRKDFRKLRLDPQFCVVFGSTYLACQTGKTYPLAFRMEIYQYIDFYPSSHNPPFA